MDRTLEIVLLSLGAIWLLWALFITIFILRWIRKLSYLAKDCIRFNKQYEAFTRNDYNNWSPFCMVLSGIFIFPVKVVLIVFFCVTALVLVKFFKFLFCVRSYDDERPVFRFFCTFVCKTCTRIICLLCGIITTYKKVTLNPSKYPKIKINTEIQTSPIMISNHTSWTDIFFYMSRLSPGFVSKAAVKKVPLVSTLAQFLQSIFVERENSSNREAALEKIEERVDAILSGRKLNSIMVFPEGTTTNGKCVIGFKKGAFSTKSGVKIHALRYNGRVNLALSTVKDIDAFLCALFQLYQPTDWIEVNGVIENVHGLDPEEFAEEVRRIFVEDLGFDSSRNTFRDKTKFEKMIQQSKGDFNELQQLLLN